MYEKRGTVYAEAGKLLRHKASGARCYQRAGVAEDYEEVDAPLGDMRIDDGLVRWGGGWCAYAYSGEPDYARIKTRLIKLRYSNDDQLAVMLNGDDDEMRRMQAWRSWAGDVAKHIINIAENK